MIYITGDTHGTHDFYKLLDNQLKNLTKRDYVIIAGDCGVLFGPKVKEYMLNLYSYLPFTVLFVDGNHENYDLLDSYPIQKWNGGKVQFLTDTVIHLLRGQVYKIEGQTFFTFGGALSYDKVRRKPHVSWWERELPSKEDFFEAMRNLECVNFRVDYVITHDCPTSWKTMVCNCSKIRNNGFIESSSNYYLEEIEKQIVFRHWYFGHYHMDYTTKNATVLYNHLIVLPEGNLEKNKMGLLHNSTNEKR